MPRIPRHDATGLWHHVMNRGIARRTLFESELDIRTFLARLAWRVHAHQLEVHAFCVLTTHFHLLVRSLTGELPSSMCVAQREYARWFNRTRRRDGPLFRGRFMSKCVDSLAYRQHLVRYIDFNPVGAGLAATPALYPHGSARCYARRDGPPWLARDWIESTVCRSIGSQVFHPRDYPAAFGQPVSERLSRLIERRIAIRKAGEDPLDDLLGAAPDQVLEWMRRKAELADGMPVGMPVCDGDDVREVVQHARASRESWRVGATRKNVDAWLQLEVALLRDLCGLRWSEIGSRLGSSTHGAWRMYDRHRRRVLADDDYANRTAELIDHCMTRCHEGVRYTATFSPIRTSPLDLAHGGHEPQSATHLDRG